MAGLRYINCSKSSLGKQTEKPASYRRARRLLISEAPAPPPPPAAAAAPVAAAAVVAAADGGQDTTSSGLHRHVRRAANCIPFPPYQIGRAHV